MKKAGYIAFAAVFFLMCGLPALLMPFASGETKENRTLAPLPGLYNAETGINTQFGEEMETYVSEHFAGREAMVTTYAKMVGGVFSVSSEGMVILGREGWLFYTPTLTDYLGTDPLREEELANLVRTLALVEEYAQSKGGDFLFMVAPNKNSLYGDYMPYYDRPSQTENDIARLAEAMEAGGVSYLDLYGLMNGQEEQLYHKRDTHWNNRGALVAYNGMMDALGQPHEDFADAETRVETTWEGDLDRLLLPAGGILDEQVEYDIPLNSLFRYRGPANVELSRVNTTGGGEGSLLFFRDSFGNALIPFVSTAYAQATYIKATPATPDLLAPGQTLALEIAQRNLRTLLEAAPRMPAPERAGGIPVEASLHTAESEEYLQVYGTLAEMPAPEAGPVGVELAWESGSKTYEAFPVYEVGLLEGTGEIGQGYSLYIPKEDLPGDDYTLTPVEIENS